jgi:sugar lactone lactonase YvrE
MIETPMIPQLEVDDRNVLGESVFWSVESEEMFWIDGLAPSIQRFAVSDRRVRRILLPQAPIGMIAETSDPRTIALTDADGIAVLNLETLERTGLAHPEAGRVGTSYNDAKVDCEGRLWVGTYDVSETEPRGCLWLLQKGRTARLAESGLPVVNGPAFAPDGDMLYLSDSIGRRILAYPVSADGSLGARRVLAQFAADEGLPDGLTVDSDGCIWVAHWDGGRVTRFSVQGERLEVIRLPVRRVTSVAFGGVELKTLFITTARYGLDEAQLSAAPQSGGLFSVQTQVPGIPATRLPVPFATR